MGKFSSDKDFAKRVSMHRDPEQHKKRDDNKKRGDNPNARRNKYKEQNNALNSRKDEHEKWGYELLNRKEQIFNQNKTTEEKAKTAAAEENKAAANAASVLSDKEIGEELNRLTAAFRATNGEKEEGELRAFAALHHLNLRVGTAVSKTDKSVIARMVFNGGVEKPMGNYSPKFADIANYPYKYAGTPGKAEDYDLESSTVWQAMKEEPRLAEMQDKLKAALAKAGVPKEILPEMNINDFKYLMFNHCAAQKGLGFAKLFQARDENGNPLTYKDRSGKEVPVCTSAKQENVKRFIKENPQFKDMMLKMPGIDKAYVEALVNKMSQSGLTDMSKELERHPEWATSRQLTFTTSSTSKTAACLKRKASLTPTSTLMKTCASSATALCLTPSTAPTDFPTPTTRPLPSTAASTPPTWYSKIRIQTATSAAPWFAWNRSRAFAACSVSAKT